MSVRRETTALLLASNIDQTDISDSPKTVVQNSSMCLQVLDRIEPIAFSIYEDQGYNFCKAVKLNFWVHGKVRCKI